MEEFSHYWFQILQEIDIYKLSWIISIQPYEIETHFQAYVWFKTFFEKLTPTCYVIELIPNSNGKLMCLLSFELFTLTVLFGSDVQIELVHHDCKKSVIICHENPEEVANYLNHY